MNTLIIKAHANIEAVDSYSGYLYRYLAEKYKSTYKENKITIIDLYDVEVPSVSKEFLSMYRKQKLGLPFTEGEQNLKIRMQELLDQFKDNKRIIIIMPVHNFNIPSKLKDYLDNILIPRETYRYTENGSIGLMNDGRKILLLQSSGSIYTNNDRYTSLEYGNFYLRSIFVEIMGFDCYDVVRAQGSDVKGVEREKILQNAYAQMDDVLKSFAK